MKKIKLIKLKSLLDTPHPNNIEEGYKKIGYTNSIPKVGEVFYINTDKGYFRTSTVVEVINETTFRTLNSIYQIIILTNETN